MRSSPERQRAGAGRTSVCSVRNLTVTYPASPDPIAAVRDVTLDLHEGELVSLVGESGSGKTTLALALLRMLPELASADGEARIGELDVLGAGWRALQTMRRHSVSVIFQDATASLNPVRTVGAQLTETARLVDPNRAAHRRLVEDALAEVDLDPRQVLRKYPFQLSGGMNQRVAIAMAMMKQPSLLVADEPTSALDVRTQATVVKLLDRVRREHGTCVLLVTHDIGLALHHSDRVAVMYGGRIVEIADRRALRAGGSHPYTAGLIRSTPQFFGEKTLQSIPGRAVPIPVTDPGCPFRQRCDVSLPECAEEFPAATHVDGASYWCWQTGTVDMTAREAR